MKFLPWDRIEGPSTVEVEATTKQLEPLTKELSDQLATLQFNPAFIWLLNRLKFQRQALRIQLESERQESQIDTEFIKSGIHWAGWLEDQLRVATQFGRRLGPEKPMLDQEIQAFQEVRRQLEIVGG